MRKIVIAILITVLSLSVCFCFVGCNKKADGTIRLNEVTHSVFYAPLYVAINEGYFEEEGITIELTNGGGANNTMTAVLSGQADIGFCGPEASVYVYNEGKTDYPKVFAQLTNCDGSFLISREKIDDFDWKRDMQGKEILGGRKGGMPAMNLEYAMKKNGLVSGTNCTINYDVQFDLLTAAFEGGQGDFVTMFEPAASAFVKAGKGYIVDAVGKEAGTVPYTCFMANQSYLEKNEDLVLGFLRALKKGVEFVQTKTKAEIAKAVLPSFDGTELSLIEESIDNYRKIGAYVNTLEMSEADFDRMQDIIIEAGVMTKKASYEALIDNSLAKKA